MSPMFRFLIPSLVVCLALTAAAADGAADRAKAYAERIHPLLVKTCGKCHGKEPKDNELDLTSLVTAEALLAQPKVLEDIAERLNEGDMPPKKAAQPSLNERDQLLGWISAAVDATAAAHAGDPGPVTLRRLTNAEYDHVVRDLTSVDVQPTRAGEFAPDSVGGEGFANVCEAMPMTPGLVERYHQAARYVAAWAVLLPTGFRFSSSPDGPDWTAEAEKALRSFHSRYADKWGRPPLAAHLAATMKHRDRLTRGGPAAIKEVAAEEKLNATYLPRFGPESAPSQAHHCRQRNSLRRRSNGRRKQPEWKPTLTSPDRSRPADGVPADLSQYWKLMNDILILVFRTDSTRIATMKCCNDASNIVHAHLGIRDHHHYIAHSQPDDLITLNQFFMSQLAYLCQRMSEIKEGDSTLLDNTAIMHCSSMLHGNHESKRLPVILLGVAGGHLRGGRDLDYLDKPNRRMCSLFLNLMDWGGLKLDRFNDSTERLPGI